jgi:hypothetical protein
MLGPALQSGDKDWGQFSDGQLAVVKMGLPTVSYTAILYGEKPLLGKEQAVKEP